jgi:hypothetical protein
MSKFYTWIVKWHLEENKIFFYISSIYLSQFGTKKMLQNFFYLCMSISSLRCFFIQFYLFSIFCISPLSYKVRYKYDKQSYVTVQICMCIRTHVVRHSERKIKKVYANINLLNNFLCIKFFLVFWGEIGNGVDRMNNVWMSASNRVFGLFSVLWRPIAWIRNVKRVFKSW